MKFYAENPDNIKFTLTITLSLKEWKEVKKALGPLTAGADIYEAIQYMINQAEKDFYPPLQ